MFEGTFASESIFHSYIPRHVPKPHAWGQYKSDPSTWFYLCDFHELVDDVVPEVRDFVSIIAKVHRESMGKKDRYGFDLPTHGTPTQRQQLAELLGGILQVGHGADARIR